MVVLERVKYEKENEGIWMSYEDWLYYGVMVDYEYFWKMVMVFLSKEIMCLICYCSICIFCLVK